MSESMINSARAAIENAKDKNVNNISMLINGYKTCSPLIAALIYCDEENIQGSLAELVSKTITYSELCFNELQISSDIDKESVRAVVLELMKLSYQFENDLIFDNAETFKSIVISLISSTVISAEVGPDEHNHTVFSQTKLAINLAVLFFPDLEAKKIPSYVAKYSNEILMCIDKVVNSVGLRHIQDNEKEIFKNILIDQSTGIIEAIYKKEQRLMQLNQTTDTPPSHTSLMAIVKVQFDNTMHAIIDVLLANGDIVK